MTSNTRCTRRPQVHPERPLVNAGRYTDRTESFFSLGFVRHSGFDRETGASAVSVGKHPAPSKIRVVRSRAVSASTRVVSRAAARGRIDERGSSEALGSIGSQCLDAARGARLWAVRKPVLSRSFRRRGAPSTDGITSGCTRRRRANLVHMQPVANRCKVWVIRRSPHRAPLAGGSALFTTG